LQLKTSLLRILSGAEGKDAHRKKYSRLLDGDDGRSSKVIILIPSTSNENFFIGTLLMSILLDFFIKSDLKETCLIFEAETGIGVTCDLA
jgi:hypothetical protein